MSSTVGHSCNYCDRGVRSLTWEFKATGFIWWNPNLKLNNLKGKKDRGGGRSSFPGSETRRLERVVKLKSSAHEMAANAAKSDPSFLLKTMW